MFEIIPFKNAHCTSYDPFKAFEDLERSFFSPFDASRRGALAPFRTDVRDADGEYVLEADLPGFAKEDINIDVEGDYLTIKAQRHSEHEDKDRKKNYVRCERSYGSYARSFDISGVDADKISAKYENGVLTLHLPKVEPAAPAARRLEIQ
ncbi:MAG: Hsp20/alpha crystallin family protein [Clostridia bacterium]|nr:Hsp20/alpha crystallin family protein [Clostridia bacterium]